MNNPDVTANPRPLAVSTPASGSVAGVESGVRNLVCYRCAGKGVSLDHAYIPPIYTNCKSCDGTGRIVLRQPPLNAPDQRPR